MGLVLELEFTYIYNVSDLCYVGCPSSSKKLLLAYLRLYSFLRVYYW
jgi:hypothetical protein